MTDHSIDCETSETTEEEVHIEGGLKERRFRGGLEESRGGLKVHYETQKSSKCIVCNCPNKSLSKHFQSELTKLNLSSCFICCGRYVSQSK